MKNIFLIIICIFSTIFAYNVQAQTSCVNVLYTGSIAEQFQYLNNYQITVYAGNCAGIAAGTYYIDEFRISFDVQGNFTNGTVTVVNNLCNGWYDIHHDPCRWGGVSWQTDEAARLYTYVTHIYDYQWAEVGWFPCEPNNARVAYQICKTIPSIVFQSNMPKQTDGTYKLARGSYGYLEPKYRNNVNCYIWCLKECDDAGCQTLQYDYLGVKSITPWNGYNFGLFNYAYNGGGCSTDNYGPYALHFYEKLIMGNVGGCTQQVLTSPKIQPIITPIGGCPWIWVQNDSELVPENNAFFKSEFTEYYGSDLKDLYLLQNTPFLDDNNTLTIQLSEAATDYTNFDQIKMYSVDHPEGTKVGITESGDIVIYYPDDVTSTDYALLNNTSNITSSIQYNYSSVNKIKGTSSDSIYAQYDTSSQLKAVKSFKNKYKKMNIRTEADSMALIGSLGHNPDYDYIIYPVNQKDWAGNVVIHTPSAPIDKQFSRREREAEVIIPFGDLDAAVDYIDVDFTNDYEVSYFSVVPVSYNGFTQTALDLISAEHSITGDISSLISSLDQDYAYLDSASVIALNFQDNTSPADENIRDYVIEFNGHYLIPEVDRVLPGNNIFNHLTGKPEIPYSYNLYQNYPNPFNPVTRIKYSIQRDAGTTLKVYNSLGQLMTTLVNSYLKAGEYEVNFNGENYPSGLYFYVLESGDFVSTKKMVLIK